MIEYETITDGVTYRIGGVSSAPISNTGELIRRLRNYGPYECPSFRYNKIGLICADQISNDVEQLKFQIISKLQEIWHIRNINDGDILEFTYNSSDFNSIKSQIDNVIDTGIDGIILILPGYRTCPLNINTTSTDYNKA